MDGESLLHEVTGVLAVVAHPDDESFGLGGVLAELTARGARATVLCFTRGEASTLTDGSADLAAVRAQELSAGAAALGVDRVELHRYPDGALSGVPLAELAGHVLRLVDEERPSHLLVFDPGGVTGHPDHDRATRAALAAARGRELPVLAWALPRPVAERLNAELGTAFTGHHPDQLDITLRVSRRRQRQAIDAHRSQSFDNEVLRRRLDLLGDREHLRIVHTATRKGEQTMSYGITVRVPAAFAPTVARVRAALAEQGFGVLTEIDVQATLRQKIGAEMEDYLILGACNPPLAHRALDTDRDIGLLLPCNVVVRSDGPDATLVQALDPQVMVQVTGRPELKDIADEAAVRLRAALGTLTG
ncbi:MAG TPA: PIG-L family deacetylase [Micromonosporaceae bacterium]|nr:PIG-L family deacetylase [Micromonosporaceae bacterium]